MNAQIGGRESFSFLNLPASPTVAGLGGTTCSNTKLGINAIFQQTALLDSMSNHQVVANFMPFVAGIQTGAAGYAQQLGGGMAAVGVQFVNYGDFKWTDDAGNVLGSFSANDVALTFGYARKQGNITIGSSIKYVNSSIELYKASALLLEIGAVFRHPHLPLSFGLNIKNLGLHFKNYTPTDVPNLPLDVQMGLTFKPQYMPVRFTLTVHHLHRWDITYYDISTQKKDLNGNLIDNQPSTVDKIARHLTLGIEVLLDKNFRALVGYNHLIRKELSVQNIGGLSGFSFGFVFNTKRIDFSYAYSSYHVAGGLHSFGVGIKW